LNAELQLDRDIAWVFSIDGKTRIGIAELDPNRGCGSQLILLAGDNSSPRYVYVPALSGEAPLGVWQPVPSSEWTAATPMPTNPPGGGIQPPTDYECVGAGPEVQCCGIAVGAHGYFVVRGLGSHFGPFSGPTSPPTYLLSLDPANGRIFSYVISRYTLPVAGFYYRKSLNRICIAIEDSKDIEVEPIVG